MEPQVQYPNPAAAALAPFAEMRGAERYALLIRTAKLVTEAGEFLCVVRDVSATGLRLKLFHPLPDLDRMAVELANGEFYFVEKVWERDGHAGFRFAAPIDVGRFMEEPSDYPRRPVRAAVSLPAMLSADGERSPVTITDLSQAGARIACDRHLAIEQRIKIEAAGLPPLFANVCWRSSPDYGLVFQQHFAFADLALMVARIQFTRQAETAMALPA